MKPIILPPLAQALPIIRAAFTAGRLQAQQNSRGSSALYSGPCAIGVVMNPDERRELDVIDQYIGVDRAVVNGYIELANPKELHDYAHLQIAHDDWQIITGTNLKFVQLLTELEAKYNVPVNP